MYKVYIIQSESNGKYYTGLTIDIEKRLRHHNSGANRSTKKQGPWKLIYTENYKNKIEAWKREKQIKSYRGGEAFKKLVNRGEVA